MKIVKWKEFLCESRSELKWSFDKYEKNGVFK